MDLGPIYIYMEGLGCANFGVQKSRSDIYQVGLDRAKLSRGREVTSTDCCCFSFNWCRLKQYRFGIDKLRSRKREMRDPQGVTVSG